MVSPYQIDIDPSAEQFSQSFKNFFHHHFVSSIGLIREEVDTSFFKTMTEEEKEIAKRLVRDNLRIRHPHLFKAAGKLKDVSALPILYEQFKLDSDLSWRLTIGQAIWRINGDNMYAELLRELPVHSKPSMKAAHLNQVTDLKNEESIEMLYSFLSDKDRFVRRLALSNLNYLLHGKSDFFENQFDRKYFQVRKDDREFKNQLLQNLQKNPLFGNN